jgi:AhpD family alkylhydroperoxidase
MTTKLSPMDLLKELAPEFAKNQMEARSLLFENERYQRVPAKYKMLTGIAVAAALGSDMCTRMWTKQAMEKGVTREEIVEAVMIARFMKQATVNDTAAGAFEMMRDAPK